LNWWLVTLVGENVREKEIVVSEHVGDIELLWVLNKKEIIYSRTGQELLFPNQSSGKFFTPRKHKNDFLSGGD
jgi:hypothetical protein